MTADRDVLLLRRYLGNEKHEGWQALDRIVAERDRLASQLTTANEKLLDEGGGHVVAETVRLLDRIDALTAERDRAEARVVELEAKRNAGLDAMLALSAERDRLAEAVRDEHAHWDQAGMLPVPQPDCAICAMAWPALAAEPREPERCPTCGVTYDEAVPAIATSPDGMWPLPCPDLFHGGAAEPREDPCPVCGPVCEQPGVHHR